DNEPVGPAPAAATGSDRCSCPARVPVGPGVDELVTTWFQQPVELEPGRRRFPRRVARRTRRGWIGRYGVAGCGRRWHVVPSRGYGRSRWRGAKAGRGHGERAGRWWSGSTT